MPQTTLTLLCLTIFIYCCHADIKSQNGVIKFDVNADNNPEMRLNSDGLSLGSTSSSANLNVAGNAIITSSLTIGATNGQSNLNLNGSLGYSIQNVTASLNISQDNSSSHILVNPTSSNIFINLPYAGNVGGRTYHIKLLSETYKAYISGGGNSIDHISSLEMGYTSGQYPSTSFVSNGEQWHILDSILNTETIAHDNLVGWWRLDESSSTTAIDSSISSLDGTLQNFNFNDNTTPGIINRALTFDGTNDSILVGNNSTFDLNHLSITAWVKPATASGYTATFRTILSKGEFNSQPYGFYWDSINGDLEFVMNNNNHNINDRITTSYDYNSRVGTWSFVCATYDGTSLNIYANGSLLGSKSYSTTLPTSTGNLILGWDEESSSDRYFNGSIDDIRLYNRALDEIEILSLYASGSSL